MAVFKNSVLRKGKQLWKLQLGIVFLVFGAAMIIYGILNIDKLSDIGVVTYVLGGIVISIMGFLLKIFLIRCPECNERWFWIAVRKKKQANWLIWLLTIEECPRCGYEEKDDVSQ